MSLVHDTFSTTCRKETVLWLSRTKSSEFQETIEEVFYVIYVASSNNHLIL